MAILHKHNALTSSAIALSGSRVELAHWINLSWFLPSGFHQKRVTTTESALLVIGTDEIYKFRLRQGKQTFQEQWSEVCEEVRDQDVLSPGLYCGVRCLRWVDDEPHWTTEEPVFDVDPQFPPGDADEAVVVYRTVAPSVLLPEMLARGEQTPESYLRLIAAKLHAFYEMQAEGAAIRFVNEGDEFLAQRKQYWRGLLDATAQYRSSLRSPIRAAIDELTTFISRGIDELMPRIETRGEEGKFVNAHGNLLCKTIAFPTHDQVWFLDRLPRSYPTRRQDALQDVCGLVADLHVAGHTRAANYFEQQYSALAGESPDDSLFSFYVATATLRRTIQYLIRAEDPSEQDRALEKAEMIAASAYRYHLGITAPVIIGIAGAQTPEKQSLTEDLARLANGFVVKHEDSVDTPCASLGAPAVEALDEGKTLIVTSPFDLRHERIELAELAEQHQAPYLLVQCELSKEEKVAQRGLHENQAAAEAIEVISEKSRFWDAQILGKDHRVIYVDPVVPSDLNATQVLRSMSTKARSSVS